MVNISHDISNSVSNSFSVCRKIKSGLEGNLIGNAFGSLMEQYFFNNKYPWSSITWTRGSQELFWSFRNYIQRLAKRSLQKLFLSFLKWFYQEFSLKTFEWFLKSCQKIFLSQFTTENRLPFHQWDSLRFFLQDFLESSFQFHWFLQELLLQSDN